MMTPKTGVSSMEEICEGLIGRGIPGLREVLETLLNHVMRMEREHVLGAKPYERCEDRKGYANGFKGREFQTRLGGLALQIPQTRGIAFYPSSLEKGLRSERALKVAVAEMYLQGVSTRRVQEITEQLCGYTVSSTEVSRIAQGLDVEIEKWRQRKLSDFAFVFLDARYEKVRYEGCVRDLAVIWAYGIREGRREVLGVSVSLSEAEVHWRSFLESLKERGLHGIYLFVSDDHSGLKAARKAVFPGVPWQRCQFHLAQNALGYVSKQEDKPAFAQKLRDLFNAPTQQMAEEILARLVQEYDSKAPKLARWLESNIPEGLTVYRFPRSYHKKIRTNNGMERINREIKRRTRVATLFPNEESCLRLVASILMEIHEDWSTEQIYLNPKHLTDHLTENLN